MSLSFCVLASGSAGNCTVLRLEDRSLEDGSSATARHILIDAGLSPRATARMLKGLNVSIHDISHILLTHLDTDHLHPGWIACLGKKRLSARLMIHHHHRAAAWRQGLTLGCAELYQGPLDLGQATSIQPHLLAHDALGSVGFVVTHAGLRLGFATDLGRVPESLIQAFSCVDALAIESNYDRRMQIESARPAFLKRRIMGGAGHLSNDQSLEAVRRIASIAGLSQLTLLHLSRQCNHPDRVRSLYTEHLPHLLDRLTIASQHGPTPWLAVRRLPTTGSTAARRRMETLPLFESLLAEVTDQAPLSRIA